MPTHLGLSPTMWLPAWDPAAFMARPGLGTCYCCLPLGGDLQHGLMAPYPLLPLGDLQHFTFTITLVPETQGALLPLF